MNISIFYAIWGYVPEVSPGLGSLGLRVSKVEDLYLQYCGSSECCKVKLWRGEPLVHTFSIFLLIIHIPTT